MRRTIGMGERGLSIGAGADWASRRARRFSGELAAAAAILLAFGSGARAAVIQFPEEELATESVLPVFDQPQSVKLRNVSTSGRFEIGPMAGYSLVEAFYQPYSLGLTASFHFNEDHAFNVLGLGFLGGTSDYAAQLNPIPKTSPPKNFNAQYGPAPKYAALGYWQYTGFYGKLSLARDWVMNLSLYGLLGAGVYGVGDASCPALSFGLGQKFYFNKTVAFRADLRFLVYNGPDVTSKDLSAARAVEPAANFDQKIQFGSLLTFGATFFLGG